MHTTKELVKKLSSIQDPVLSEINIKQAYNEWAEFRHLNGFKKSKANLLTPPAANLKLSKGEILNYGLSLAPAKVSGVLNTCSYSTKGCRDLCINTSGNGKYPITQKGRIVKTKFLIENPKAFLTILKKEINDLRLKNYNENIKVAVRLNVFSDIPWEKACPWLFDFAKNLQFYDYTKYPDRFNSLPKNYHLTYSASERDSDDHIKQLLRNKTNVTIVADKIDGSVPTTWNRFKVHDGDIDDYRPADPKGVVVFLKPKGKALNKVFAPRGKFIRKAEGFKA